jgi:cytosine/adenosine deaminase-related metal-dependent hydrolase
MTLIVADYVLDENMTLQKGWGVHVDENGRIAEIGPSRILSGKGWRNLGRAVLVPGFINCHTHLELTALAHEVHKTHDFVAWLDEVSAGVTTIANHCNSGLSLDAMAKMPARSFILFELIAFDSGTLKKRLPTFKRRIRTATGRADALFEWGLAPHAPYSVSREFFEWIKKRREKTGCILSIHVHEHTGEGDFLKTGKGPFKKMLERLGIDVSGFEPPGLSPTEYLRDLGLLGERTLLVHCNYVGDSDIDIIKESGSTVVFCPRSHAYFGHKNHPLSKLLERGIPVALGTDGLVSNDSLSMLDEMRFLRKHFPNIPADAIFAMATAAGADALGIGEKTGQLTAGREADIAALGNLPDKNRITLDDLLAPEVTNVFTMIAGREVYKQLPE